MQFVSSQTREPGSAAERGGGEVVLTLSGIARGFQQAGTRVEVLRDVSLRLRRGESLAVMGPSGSGKTTLLHVAGGVISPDGGEVRVDGIDPCRLDADGLAAFRQRRVGLVFQEHHLLPQLSALENVLLPVLACRRRALDEDVRFAERLLAEVGLGARLHHRPAQLSGGERQRVAVARALINRPALVLADEPTAALDRATAADVAQLLAAAPGLHGVALLAATHDPELARRLDRTLLLRDGRVVRGEGS